MHEPSAIVDRLTRYSLRPAARPGNDVISLATGDPDFATPEYIRQALSDAIEQGYTHYVDNQGDPELRQALATSLSQRSSVPWSPAEITITHGGSGAIAAAILGTVDPGHRVLLPEPTYSLYSDLVRFVGAEPVYVKQTEDWHLDLDVLRAAAPGARMLVLCHPCNPTGVVYRREELEAVAEIAVAHNMFVLADEAYDHIVFDGVEFVSTLQIPALRPWLLYCQTFSKTYAMTGWRVGYLAGPSDVVSAGSRVHRTTNGAMNAAVQRAALAAVTVPSDFPSRMREEYQTRRRTTVNRLATVPGISFHPPEGTFYVWIRSDLGLTASAMAAAAREHGVAVRAGNEYGPGGDHHIRIAFSSSRDELTAGLDRLVGMFSAQAADHNHEPAAAAVGG
jgi:aspartate aminotransferase